MAHSLLRRNLTPRNEQGFKPRMITMKSKPSFAKFKSARWSAMSGECGVEVDFLTRTTISFTPMYVCLYLYPNPQLRLYVRCK